MIISHIYKYFWILMVICFTTQKKLASEGRKAMLALKSFISNSGLNHCSLLYLFDTHVCSIISYHKGAVVEKIHLDFLRYVLGVRRTQIESCYILKLVLCHGTSIVLYVCWNIGSNCSKKAIVFKKLPMNFYIVNVKPPIFRVLIGQAIIKISCLILA